VTNSPATPTWFNSAAALLTRRRIRAHAVILAICLWSVCIVNFATPGLFDRAGNIKFQDFLQFPISASLIAQGRATDLYNDQILAENIRAIVGVRTNVFLRYFYGPQVALPFIPLIHFQFLVQAAIWVTLSLFLYFGSVYLLCRTTPNLAPYRGLVALCAVAYPPVFHFFVRGQISALPLVCFTAAYFAFREQHDLIAGIFLGCLIFKPQFLVAITLVLLVARAWKVFAAVAASAGLQLVSTYIYFGPEVMRLYLKMLLHSALNPATTELSLSGIQMHSLHSFWDLLLPWPRGVWFFYLLSLLVVIAFAAAIWKSSAPQPLRFSALLLATVLVNPHIFIYDLLALAPALLLLADWVVENRNHRDRPMLGLLLYLAFICPLFGPLARWTHIQLSVVVFASILLVLYFGLRSADKLASNKSPVV
jgi:alpha-1,2-mannosyltransferase